MSTGGIRSNRISLTGEEGFIKDGVATENYLNILEYTQIYLSILECVVG